MRDGAETLPLRAPKQRALLTLLLLEANRQVTLERIVDGLWEDPPPSAQQAVQVYISKLRKLLTSADAGTTTRLVTRPGGYMLEVEPETVDLRRFERLVTTARQALAAGDPAVAGERLGEALALWRGHALEEFDHEPFASAESAHLRELHLDALELDVEARLALGWHAAAVADLAQLAEEHPLREGIRAKLMLALYRSGRQADALQVFQETRTLLLEELGLDPGHGLQDLERAILRHDPALDVPAEAQAASRPQPAAHLLEQGIRAVLACAIDEEPLDDLLALGRSLVVTEPPHELVVIRLLASPAPPAGALSRAAAEVAAVRTSLTAAGIQARGAAFTSVSPADDLVRFAAGQEIDLLLLDAGVLDREDEPLGPLLASASFDVALLHRIPEQPISVGEARPPAVVFGGSDADWAALELGAWLARGAGTALRLLGTAADADQGRRDASRLLASASLVVQQFSGVFAEPVLAPAGSDGVLEASRGAGVVLIGLAATGERPLGPGYRRVVSEAEAPILFVCRGHRPTGIAPEGLTRHTWALSGDRGP